MAEDKDKIIRVLCRKCKQITNHSVLHKFSRIEENEEHEVWEQTDFLTAQCNGCEVICLVQEYSFSEEINPETGELKVTTTVFPDPHQTRVEVEGFFFLPEIVRKIYKESVNAMNRNLPILTSIGIRSTIEAICLDQGITNGGLNQKIDTLVLKGFITKQEAELLHLNRFMGNAAAHELQEPDADELSTGMDIIEAALRNAYILPKKAKFIKQKHESEK